MIPERWAVIGGAFMAGLLFTVLVVVAAHSSTGPPALERPGRLATGAEGWALPLPPAAADQYTAVPPDLSGAEIRRRYPANLRLASLQVVHRHGERTPIDNAFSQLLPDPSVWRLCWEPGVTEEFTLRTGRSAPFRFGALDNSGRPLPDPPAGACAFGQLTDKGRRSLLRLGAYLRGLYVDRLQFLPEEWGPDLDIFIRTTDVPRTQHSVLSLLMGLYPMAWRSALLPTPVVYHLPGNKEYLYTTPNCAQETALQEDSERRDPALAPRRQRLREAHPALRELLDAYHQPAGAWTMPAVTALDDTLVSLVAHGRPLPPGIDAAAMRDLRSVATQEAYGAFETSALYVRLTSGRLIGEVVERIDAVLSAPNAPAARLALYSVHDATVAPLLLALGVYDNQSPLFASFVTIELLVDDSDAGAAFFRVAYNGQPLPLPFCAPSAAPPHLCPWPTARRRLLDLQLTPAEYAELCERQEKDDAERVGPAS